MSEPSRRLGFRVKYAVDRLAAGALLLLAGPLLVAIAVVIAVRDGRPLFFTQTRVGEGGKEFRIFKFRTMVPDAEGRGGGYLPPGMDLITPTGRWLRRLSLDELPQLVNVARGQMSFVGPRPALPDQVARYTPEQRVRLRVRPGLTGLAQVRGRNALTLSHRIRYDVDYVTNWTPMLEVRILLETVPLVFRSRGVVEVQTIEEVDDLGH